MNAVLNIYADCSTDQPTKTYVCKRLLLGVSKKVQALSENMQGKTQEEQIAINLDVIKTIFPDFVDSEFDYIDINEWYEFVEEIGRETNAIVRGAAKK